MVDKDSHSGLEATRDGGLELKKDSFEMRANGVEGRQFKSEVDAPTPSPYGETSVMLKLNRPIIYFLSYGNNNNGGSKARRGKIPVRARVLSRGRKPVCLGPCRYLKRRSKRSTSRTNVVTSSVVRVRLAFGFAIRSD